MNKQLMKQFLIALLLFLLGYFSFNNKLFAQELTHQLPGTHSTLVAEPDQPSVFK